MLFAAIRTHGDARRIEDLLSMAGASASATVNTTVTMEQAASGGLPDGEVSPLMLAVVLNRPIVKLLLGHGADANWARPHDGDTAVIVAAWKGHAEALRVLAEHGANLDTPNNEGDTPALIAAHRGHAEVVKVLARAGGGGG